MVSQAAEDRLKRIAEFKDRISNLRATSKVYNLHSDKSITTLDSQTTNGSSVLLPASPGPHHNDNSEKRNPVEESRSTALTTKKKNNPFDDDESGYERNTPSTPNAEPVSLNYKKSPNPFCKSPNPFDDNDDDSSSSSCSSVDDSFTGLAEAFRKARSPTKQPMNKVDKSTKASRNSDLDTLDSSTINSYSNSNASQSVDGVLFSDFKDVLQGKKSIEVEKTSLSQDKSVSLGKKEEESFTSSTVENKLTNVTTNSNPFADDSPSSYNASSESSASSAPSFASSIEEQNTAKLNVQENAKANTNPFAIDGNSSWNASSEFPSFAGPLLTSSIEEQNTAKLDVEVNAKANTNPFAIDSTSSSTASSQSSLSVGTSFAPSVDNKKTEKLDVLANAKANTNPFAIDNDSSSTASSESSSSAGTSFVPRIDNKKTEKLVAQANTKTNTNPFAVDGNSSPTESPEQSSSAGISFAPTIDNMRTEKLEANAKANTSPFANDDNLSYNSSSVSSSSTVTSFAPNADNKKDEKLDVQANAMTNANPFADDSDSSSNASASTDGILFSGFQKVIRAKKSSNPMEKRTLRKITSVGSMNFESSSTETSLTSVPENSNVAETNARSNARTNPFLDEEESSSNGHAKPSREVHWNVIGNVPRDAKSTSSETSPDEASLESSHPKDIDSFPISTEEEIFTDLNKALSKIQSVSYEEEEEIALDDEKHDRATAKEKNKPAKEEFVDDEEKPAGMKSHITVPDGSCAISSLKDDEKFETMSIVNEGTYDDIDDVASVPKCPAPLEIAPTSHTLMVRIGGDGESDEVSFVSDRNKALKLGTPSAVKNIEIKNLKLAMKSKSSGNSEESVLVPPKKDVVLRDGSISTKDSILGRMISVANVDLVTERIYLESLRAQVHAELKVHVADEEIRLALDARLGAIRDFYKRKATVNQLKLNHQDDLLEKAYSLRAPLLPKKIFADNVNPQRPSMRANVYMTENAVDQPMINVSSNKRIDTYTANQAVAPPKPTRNVTNEDLANECSSHTQSSHKFAFERALDGIDEALKAAHIPTFSQTQSELEEVDDDDDDDDDVEVIDEIQAIGGIQASQSSIPNHIFAGETFWDEEQIVPSPTSESSLAPKLGDTVTSAWSFYRMLNGLIFDSRVYDYKFKILQEDPLYPYLNSLVGIADGGEDGFTNENKRISQKDKVEYLNQSAHRICHRLSKEAAEVLPKLQLICADIGGKLGMQTVAVGPIKKPSTALLKSERKYEGNPLLVTDYCRISLFVSDVATLLALIEIVLSNYANIVRRIKLSSLKSNHASLVGGYRDCKINIDIDGHICEIQVHLESLWDVKEENGYAHYKCCCENSVNMSSFDISRTLDGLEREFESDLIKAGENAANSTPVESLKCDNEDCIRDYSALVSLYLHYGLPVRAEYTLRQLVKLRIEHPNFGPSHVETILFLNLLLKSLKCQHKYKKASEVRKRITRSERLQRKEDEQHLSEMCTKDHCGALEFVFDLIVDPSKRERKDEKEKADKIEESRALWLNVRRKYFK